MYSLLKMGIFHCYIGLPEGNTLFLVWGTFCWTFRKNSFAGKVCHQVYPNPSINGPNKSDWHPWNFTLCPFGQALKETKSLLPTHHEFAEIRLTLNILNFKNNYFLLKGTTVERCHLGRLVSKFDPSECCSCCKVETTGMADPVPIVRSPPAVNGCFIDIPGGDQEISEVFFQWFWALQKKNHTQKTLAGLEDRVEEKCWVKVPNLMKYWDPSNAFSYWDFFNAYNTWKTTCGSILNIHVDNQLSHVNGLTNG